MQILMEARVRWTFVFLVMVNVILFVWQQYWGQSIAGGDVIHPVMTEGAAQIRLIQEPATRTVR